MSPMKTTLRLPDALAEQATAYADSLGIALNSLCAVALRDYLLQRPMPVLARPAVPVAHPVASPVSDQPTKADASTRSAETRASAPAGGSIASQATAGGFRAPPAVPFMPQVHPRTPCPCGSGKLYGKCCRGKS